MGFFDEDDEVPKPDMCHHGVEQFCDRCSEEFDAGEDEGEDCWACGGAGYVLDECWEDTCPCADPETQHDMVLCPECS